MNKLGVFLFVGVMFGLSQTAASQFVSDSTNVQTVAAIKQMDDNAWFTLEGYIVKQVREEKYVFRDQSGEIEVEIDKDKWKGRKVTPSTKIRIAGKVEKEWLRSMEVEVKRIELVDGDMKTQDRSNSAR